MNIKDLPQGSYKVVNQPQQPANSGVMNIKDLAPGSFKTITGQQAPPQAFRYQIDEPAQAPAPTPVVDRTVLKAQYAADAEKAQKESDRANSPLGFAMNYGKALIDTVGKAGVGVAKAVTSSERALGDTIGKILKNPEDAVAQHASLIDSNMKLRKLIAKGQAEGKDVTALMRGYNSTQDLIDELDGQIQSHFKELPTTKEVVGQLAGTGLDILTAGTYKAATQTGKMAFKAPTVAKEISTIFKKPAEIISKRGLGKVLEGAGVGYGYDVTQGLQDNEENPYAPGLGTLLGAGIPIAARGTEIARNSVSKTKAVDELEQAYTDWMSGTTPGKKKVDKLGTKTEMLNRSGTEGRTPQRTLAESGVIPKRSGTKLDTYDQAGEYRETTKPLRDANRQALNQVGLSTQPVPLNDLEAIAVGNVRSQKNIDAGLADGLEKQVRGEFEKLRKVYGDSIPLSKMDDIKSARWDEVFKNKSLIDVDRLRKDSDYAIAKAMQKQIEDVAAKAGHVDVAQLNREIGDRLEAAKFLEDLNGKTIKGGRVLKYVTTLIGSGLGDTIPGKVAGALGGNLVGNLIISANIASPLKRFILRNLETTDPKAYVKTIEWLQKQNLDKETRLLLPAPGQSLAPKGQKGSAIPSVIQTPAPTTFEAPAQKINTVQSKSPTAQQTKAAMTRESNKLMGQILPYTPNEKLPVIPFGPKAKSKFKKPDDTLPTIQGKSSLGALIGTAGAGTAAVGLGSASSNTTYQSNAPKPTAKAQDKPEGSLSAINNNPGNLIFKGQAGATQGEKRPDGTYWAVFKSPEAGFKAMGRDIEIKLERKPEMTLRELIETRSPESDGNDVNSILYNISDELFDIKNKDGKIFNGKSQVKDIPMERLLKAILKSEG